MASTQIPHTSSLLPLYQQIKEYILARIAAGRWLPETRIPSENELVAQLGVSRMTVNRALRELTFEGHLMRIQGVGTFVAARKPQLSLLEIKSIAQEIRSRGGRHSSEVHLLQEEKATTEIAAGMGISTGARVFHSILVHRDRDLAIQLADRYINPAIVPEYLNQDFTTITPSEYLLNVAPVTEVEHVIEAILPDKEIQNHLEIESTEPCLLLYRRTWVQGTVATRNRFIYPGSRYRIGGRFTPQSSMARLTP